MWIYDIVLLINKKEFFINLKILKNNNERGNNMDKIELKQELDKLSKKSSVEDLQKYISKAIRSADASVFSWHTSTDMEIRSLTLRKNSKKR